MNLTFPNLQPSLQSHRIREDTIRSPIRKTTQPAAKKFWIICSIRLDRPGCHDEALADDVYSRIQNVNTRIEETNTVNSYFVDALSEQLIEDLTSEDGLGYSQTQAENALYSGGLTIYSTQNLTMQNICDEELNDDNNYPANIDWGVDYALTVYHTDGSVDNYSAGHLKQFGADQYGDDEGLLLRITGSCTGKN